MIEKEKCESCYRFHLDADKEDDEFDGYCLRTTLVGIELSPDGSGDPADVIPPKRVSIDFCCEDFSPR